MPELPSALHTDNHLLWLLIGLCVAMVFTLEAVQAAVEGAWPHERRPATMLPHERSAQAVWGFTAILLLIGGLLAIANLAILLWQDLERSDAQSLGTILLAVAWLVFLLTGIDRFGVRAYVTSIGAAAPLAVLAILLVALSLLGLSLADIMPPLDEFRESLPIIAARMPRL